MTAGRLVIMGSGEMAPTMVATHRDALAAAAATEMVVLDTPFGFQENVEQLTARLVEFFDVSLQTPAVVASLRGVDHDPVDGERFRVAVAGADAVFAGPGSPSHALRVWRDHDVGALLAGVVSRGGSLVMASAAALTLGSRTIPVYEIYKVGEDPHWLDGLDVMGRLGVPCVVIPHWNNAEGGNHDTSRCYIGRRRLGMLAADLDVGILGVDEHTAATVDLGAGVLAVTGKGTVTLRGVDERVLASGDGLDLDIAREVLGSPSAVPPPAPVDRSEVGFEEALAAADVGGIIAAMLSVEERIDADPALRTELRSMIVRLGDAAGRGLVDPRSVVEGFVDLLLELRRRARDARRYDESDRIRDGLVELGVEVRDTAEGAVWELDQNP